MKNEKVVDLTAKKTGRIIGIAAVILVILIVLFNCIAIVPAGHTGVVLTFGKVSDEGLSEGLHFKIPIAQQVINISNKIQVYEADADAVSRDLQSVSSKIAVNYRIIDRYSASVYKNIGTDYQSIVLMPMVQESMKSVCAKYTAEDLITKRAQVGNEIKDELESKVEEYGIQIEKFNMVNFDFSAEFNKAIEEKQVAEQNLLRTKTEQDQALVIAKTDADKKVIAAEADAKAIKARAEAQADANRTISASLDQDLINYEIVQRWNGELPKVAGSANPLVTMELEGSGVEAAASSASGN